MNPGGSRVGSRLRRAAVAALIAGGVAAVVVQAAGSPSIRARQSVPPANVELRARVALVEQAMARCEKTFTEALATDIHDACVRDLQGKPAEARALADAIAKSYEERLKLLREELSKVADARPDDRSLEGEHRIAELWRMEKSLVRHFDYLDLQADGSESIRVPGRDWARHLETERALRLALRELRELLEPPDA